MLFFVVENFRDGDPARVHERFASQGRLLPPNVRYVESWMDVSGRRCFQLMEAPDEGRFAEWTAAWSDLIEFDIAAVVPSAAYWTQFKGSAQGSGQ